jgi:uncharacterized protein (TIGR03437 family)
MFMVGVFLDDLVPKNPAPPRLDFTNNESFTTLAPLIGQTFFVGDGLTGTGVGTRQQFVVPAAATRLFLGIADANEWQGDPSWYFDNGGAFTAVVEISGGVSISTSARLPDGVVGTAYSQTLSASGGSLPYSWSVSSGALPPGLSLNASSGSITGRPIAAGTFTFTVQVADSTGAKADAQFSLTIIGVAMTATPTSLAFSYLLGDPPPAGQRVSLSSAAPLSFVASASTTSGGNWLAVSPPSGTTPGELTVLINPMGLEVGIYAGTVVVGSAGATNNPQIITVQLFVSRPGGPPQFLATGILNAASFAAGPVAPGEIIAIIGTGLGPGALTGFQIDENGQVATTLADTRVLFDNIPAPLLYVQASQLSAIVPYAVAGTTQAKVEVRYKGAKSNAVVAQVAASALGIFTLDSSGKGQGAILNQNYSLNSPANPAEKGAVVILYGTGEGETNPQVADGRLASSEELPRPKLPVSVKVGGVEAEVLYAGSAPGMVVGLLQVNLRVPPGVASGNAVPVVLTIGSASSPPGVTMAVK